MEAKDLRIGNFVTTEYKSDDYLIVSGIIAPDEIFCYEPGKTAAISGNWLPIPLNEKWLKRLGFKLMEKDMGIWQLLIDKKHIAPCSKGAYDIVALLTDGVAKANCCVNGWWSTRSMQYVHEIQNAYYFITGEELTAPAGDAGKQK